jgi:hypothetical protein
MRLSPPNSQPGRRALISFVFLYAATLAGQFQRRHHRTRRNTAGSISPAIKVQAPQSDAVTIRGRSGAEQTFNVGVGGAARLRLSCCERVDRAAQAVDALLQQSLRGLVAGGGQRAFEVSQNVLEQASEILCRLAIWRLLVHRFVTLFDRRIVQALCTLSAQKASSSSPDAAAGSNRCLLFDE